MKKFFSQLFIAMPSWVRTLTKVVACMAVGGGISLALGRDVSISSFIQTLYSAHAFLTGRMSVDLFAAGEGPALNPLLYIPYYLVFVNLNNFPVLSVFLFGLPYGLLFFFVWRMGCSLFKEKFVVGLFAVFAVTGTATLANIGVGNGAILLAVLLVWACTLTFDVNNPHKWKWGFFIAAVASGLHFSAFPALVGLFVAYWFLCGEKSRGSILLQNLMFICAGLMLAFSVAVWYSWKNGTLDSFFGFFWPQGWALGPSPWAEAWEFPTDLREWVLLPFWRVRYALSGYVVDVRLACGVLCAVILFGKRLFSPREEGSRLEVTLSLFFSVTYLGWLLGWRTADTSIVLECIGTLLLGQCLVWLIGKKAAVLAAALLLWVLFPLRAPADRQGIEKHNFSFFREPVIAENSLVLLSGHVSGLIPFLPQNSRYIGGVWFDPKDYPTANEFFMHQLNPLPKGYYSHRRDDAIRAAVLAHAGAIYALIPQEKAAAAPTVWQRYGITFTNDLKSCQVLNAADVTGRKELLLCPVQKISEKE